MAAGVVAVVERAVEADEVAGVAVAEAGPKATLLSAEETAFVSKHQILTKTKVNTSSRQGL